MKSIIVFAFGIAFGWLLATFKSQPANQFAISRPNTASSIDTLSAQRIQVSKSQSVKMVVKLDGESRPVEVWCQPRINGDYDQNNGLVYCFDWDTGYVDLKEYRRSELVYSQGQGKILDTVGSVGLLMGTTYDLVNGKRDPENR